MNKKNPPIVIKLRDIDLPLRNKDGMVRIISNPQDFPIGKVYEDDIDGYKSMFKVLDHQYIGKDLVAIIVDQILQ